MKGEYKYYVLYYIYKNISFQMHEITLGYNTYNKRYINKVPCRNCVLNDGSQTF